MKKLILFCLLSLMGAASAHADMLSSGTQIKMITRDNLMLSDLFSGIPTTQNMVIGSAPKPGQDLNLNQQQLARVAAAYGVSFTPTQATDTLVLRREGFSLTNTQIKNMLIDSLRDKGVAGDIDLTFSNGMESITLPVSKGAKIAVQNMNYDPTTGLFDARLNMPAAPLISGRVEQLMDVPVARANLSKGTLLDPASIDMVKMKQSQVGSESILDTADLSSFVTRRAITAGRPIFARDLERPLSVRRGDKVTILYRTGIMELSAQGRALQDGRTGDRVGVANTDSNKNLQGTVIADGQVVID